MIKMVEEVGEGKDINKWVNQVIQGDCREVLKQLPDGCVDMVLTDPPWMVSSEVRIHRAMNPVKYKYVGKDIILDFGKWDHFENEEEYWKFTKEWFSEAVRVLKNKGHLITFFDQNKVSYLIDYAKSLGMLMRQHLYWKKTNPVPRARKVDFMISLEHACWFTKGTKSGATFNYWLGQQSNCVEASIPNNPRYHPTEKPVKVLSVWVNYLTNEGDIVLDPMCGSGSTLVASKMLRRGYLGIEIDPKYVEVARKRLEETVSSRDLLSLL